MAPSAEVDVCLMIAPPAGRTRHGTVGLDAPVHDAEALFAEAHRRRRHRVIAGLACTVLAA